MKIDAIMDKIELVLKRDYQTTLLDATPQQLHDALGAVVMGAIAERWYESRHAHARTREAYYFSAEYLVGRMVYNNLFSLGMLDEIKEEFQNRGLDLAVFEDIEDAALGNGGLPRQRRRAEHSARRLRPAVQVRLVQTDVLRRVPGRERGRLAARRRSMEPQTRHP